MTAQARTERFATTACSVLTVATGTVFAVGGSIPPKLSVSWLRGGREGWMPVQCYVFRDGPACMILDSGLAIHTGEIECGLGEALAGADPPKALVSRWEPDSMVNLPWLIDRFGVQEVLSYGGINPLDFFEGFETAAAAAQLGAASGPARLVAVAPLDVVEVGSLRIEVLTASLRLLLTSWFYEHTTRSLFTADSFGFLTNPLDHPLAPGPFIAQPRPEHLSPDMLCQSFAAKFDWLAGACCDPLIHDLEVLQDRFVIDRVCPAFGGIIEGRTNVSRLFSSAIAALRRLQGQNPERPLAGFDWPRALSPAAVVDLSDPDRIPPDWRRMQHSRPQARKAER